MADVFIRKARVADAPQLARLTTELGYRSTVADIRRRLPTLLGRRGSLLVVAADRRDRAVGWLQASVHSQLQHDPFVEIVGLVIASAHRSRGFGAALVAEAERWSRRMKLRVVRVRSNVVRTETHEFYLRLGYSRTKTSHLFVKEL